MGPAPNPGIFLGMARKVIVNLPLYGLMSWRSETDRGSVGTQPREG